MAASGFSVDTAEELERMLQLLSLFKMARDQKLIPTRQAQIARMLRQSGYSAGMADTILENRSLLIKIIDRMELEHNKWLQKVTAELPAELPPPPPKVEDSDCGICTGENGKAAPCCGALICEECTARVEKCPYCTRAYELPEGKKFLLEQEKAVSDAREKIKALLIDKLSLLLTGAYGPDSLQESLESATDYFGYFQNYLDTFPEEEILSGDYDRMADDFIYFAAMLVAWRKADPYRFKVGESVTSALATIASGEDAMRETYLTMAGFQPVPPVYGGGGSIAGFYGGGGIADLYGGNGQAVYPGIFPAEGYPGGSSGGHLYDDDLLDYNPEDFNF